MTGFDGFSQIFKMKDEIKIIKESSEAEYKEKGSRFIALASPIPNEGEALNILERIKKKYYDASHHCYAYKLHNNKSKYSDAGEPTGTAGVRILNAIEHFGLTDTIVIVVRYFGGIKLGAGGLGKAYYNSALEVLSKAEIIMKKLYKRVFIKSEIHFNQKIYHIINNNDSKILKVDYTDEVNFECLITVKDFLKVISYLKDITNGKIEISGDEFVYM
jgi:uncharacterized YigZ family protein